jgi:hypothetical protein
VDAIAIGGGTWTINPEDTRGLLMGGVLARESHARSARKCSGFATKPSD